MRPRAFASAPPGNGTCGLVVDRHVPKSAGTTVRTMLRANERAGRCAFLGYDVGATWRSRVGFNHRNMKQIGYAAGARLCVEAHVVSDTFWADLLRARADFAARACVVVTMVRVREPLSWYRSYYEWMVVGRIRGGQGWLFGDNFTDWLPYNLQSRFLLWGDPVAAGERRVRGGIGVEGSRLPLRPNRTGAGRARRRLSTAQWTALRRILHAADIVAPTERLDESLVLLGRLAGFLVTTGYQTLRPGPTRGPWSAKQVATVAGFDDFCGGTPAQLLAAQAAGSTSSRQLACRAAVRAAAHDDFDLHALAVSRFARQLDAHRANPAYAGRPSFDDDLKRHRDALGCRVGKGKPDEELCAWKQGELGRLCAQSKAGRCGS